MLNKMQKKYSNIPTHDPLSRRTTSFSALSTTCAPLLHGFSYALSSVFSTLTLFSYPTYLFVISLFVRHYLTVTSSRKSYKVLELEGWAPFMCFHRTSISPLEVLVTLVAWSALPIIRKASSREGWCLPWWLLSS